MSELADKHAAVIGINAYGNGLAALRTAAADARAVATALKEAHGYRDPIELVDARATLDGIVRLLEETLPARVAPDSGLVLYFAGHGVALDDDGGPQGYFIPQDASSSRPETWLPMDRVRQALAKLPCRHLLVVLDCCFAGSFRWAATRKTLLPAFRPLYDSQYARFLEGQAWQVLTSASHDEEAQDVVPGIRNTRDRKGMKEHSPFATALLEGLAGEADSSRGGHAADGVITATELYQYVFEELVPVGQVRRQTPGLWPLKPDNTGELVFLSPAREKTTRPDPPLDDANNPWLGLMAYGEGDAPLFFGRERVVKKLLDLVSGDPPPPLLAVVGASGTGKSSVVKAGLLPRLTTGSWSLCSAPRLAGDPGTQLAEVERRLAASPAGRKLLFIDQFEELYTQCRDRVAQEGFLQRLRELATGDGVPVLLTLRSEFVPRLKASKALGNLLGEGLYPVPALTSEELREIIEEPARAKALYFEPGKLVGELIDEVTAMPGALPLLSFALAEMYRQAQLRRRETGVLDRALTRQDYEKTGGVVGALHRRANELIEVARVKKSLDTVRRVALRMVSLEGGRVARRRILRRELDYGFSENKEVTRVVETLTEARLLVADQSHLEPAHDTLVLAWPQLTDWIAEAAESLPLLRALWRDAEAWKEGGEPAGLLWSEDPRLPQVKDLNADLNQLEGKFIRASRRRRYLHQLALTGVVALLAVAAIYSASKRVEAEAALVEARNRKLAALARSYQHDQLDLALLLSLELERGGAVFEARRLLFEGLESSPHLERLLHDRTAVRTLAWSADGRWLATGGADSHLRLWDAATAEPRGPPCCSEGDVWSLAWSHYGQLLAEGGRDGVRLWEVDAPHSEPRRLGEAKPTYAVAWSPDGRTLAAAQDDHSVRLWDVESGGVAAPPLVGATDWLTSIAWSPDGCTVAAAGMDEKIRRWDAVNGEPIGPPLRAHTEGVMSLAWSADGRILASASLDGTAILWDVATVKPRGRPLDSLIGPVASVAWSAADTLAVGGIDGRVVLWDMTGEPPRARLLTGQLTALRHMSWSGDGRTLASGNGSAVALWSAGDGPRLGRRVELGGVELGASEMRRVAMSYDGKTLAAEGRDPISRELTFRLWDVASGEPRGIPVQGLRRWTAALAMSADGRTLAAAGLDRTVRRWDIATGSAVCELRLADEPAGRFSSLAWSAGGRLLAAGSRDGQVSLWDASTGEPLGGPRTGHAGRVLNLSWSDNGTALASAGKDGTIQLWTVFLETVSPGIVSPGIVSPGIVSPEDVSSGDVATLQPRGAPLAGHGGLVTSLAWSVDGRTLAVAGNGGRIVLWDVERRTPFVGPFGNHPDQITGLHFSPDGTALLSISLDGTLMRWDVDPVSWRRRACHLVNRNLTREEWKRFLDDSPYRRTCPEVPSPLVRDLEPIQEAES